MLDQLSEEVLFSILMKCDLKTLFQYMLTSKKGYRLAKDNLLWKEQYQKYLPHIFKPHLTFDSWEVQFKEDYLKNYPKKEQRQLIRALLESDIQALRSMPKATTWHQYSLYFNDKHFELLQIVKNKKNNQVMDALFDILKEEYTHFGSTHVNGFMFSLFRLAMFLEQPVSFLKRLTEKDDYAAISQDKRAEVNHASSTALLDIVHENNFEILKTLPLKPGNAIVNHQSPNGETALLLAIAKGNLKIVEQLIAFGANLALSYKIDSYDGVYYYSGCTALHMAVLSKRIDIVDVLLKAGAPLNPQDHSGRTPFICAASIGHIEIAELLFKKAETINKKDVETIIGTVDFALATAIEGGHTAFALWIMKSHIIDESFKYKADRSLLHLAASKVDKDVCIALLQEGVSVNEQDDNLETPFFSCLSSIARNYEKRSLLFPMLDIFLAHDAELNVTNKNKETLFSIAVRVNNLELLRILIYAGTKIDVLSLQWFFGYFKVLKNRYGLGKYERRLRILEEFLSLPEAQAAALSSHNSILRLLIEKKGDINTQDENGNTLLHLAIANAAPKEFLIAYLEAGADTEVVNNEGFTPLLLAIQNNNLPHVHCLHEKGARFDNLEAAYTPLQVAVERTSSFSPDIIEYLLSQKAHVFEKNRLWKKSLLPSTRPKDTLLHAFIRSTNYIVQEKFLDQLFTEEANILVDTLNEDNQTALMLAVRNRNISQVNYLLEKGANASIHTEQGLSIFFEAANRVSSDIHSSSLVWERLQQVNPEFGKQLNENENVLEGFIKLVDKTPLYSCLENALLETKFKALPYLLKWNKTVVKTRFKGKRWLLADLIQDLSDQESLDFLDKQSFHLFLQALLKHEHQLSVHPSKDVPSMWKNIQTIIEKNKKNLLPLDPALLEDGIRKDQYGTTIVGEDLDVLLPYMDTSDFRPYSAIRELPSSIRNGCISYCSTTMNKLDLMIYLIKADKRADGHYKRAYHLFGDYHAGFGYSAKEKKAAAHALKEVVFHGAAIETLEPYKHALTNGELSQIFRRFYPEEYKEWRSWHTDLKMAIHANPRDTYV